MFGMIRRYKNIELAIDAIRRTEGVRLIVAGPPSDPEYLSELREMAYGLDVDFDPRFLSPIEVRDFFAGVDFSVFCYHDETFLTSGAFYESLSYGVPVIVPDQAMFRSYADRSYVHLYRGADDLARVLSLLPGPVTVQRQVESIRQDIVGTHSWDDYARQVQAALKRPPRRDYQPT